jgi:hypothetical protein
MAEIGVGKPSYLAMLLSLIIPGLGQLYLRKPLKGVICFLGVVAAVGIMYINSLPVDSWRDLIDFSGAKAFWKAQNASEHDDASPEDSVPPSENKRPHYHLYTFAGDLRFRMGLEYENDLNNLYYISVPLHRVFQENKIVLTDNAQIVVRKKDMEWLVDDKYQMYLVKKQDGELNVYEGKKLMFRPSWKFKATGLIQGLLFWGYAIFDGWQGRRGFSRRFLRKIAQETGE